jgi:hypothetical protein
MEFSEATRSAIRVQALIKQHNEKVKAFVDFEGAIIRKLKAISVEGMGRSYDEQPEAEQFNIVMLLWYFDKKYTKDPELSDVESTPSTTGLNSIFFMWGPNSRILAKTNDPSKKNQLLILITEWWEIYADQRSILEKSWGQVTGELRGFRKEVEKLSYKFVYGLPLKHTCSYEDTLE